MTMTECMTNYGYQSHALSVIKHVQSKILAGGRQLDKKDFINWGSVV